MSSTKSPQPVEGKKPKWKLFSSKSRTPSKEVLSHSLQETPPVPQSKIANLEQHESPRTSQTSSTLTQDAAPARTAPQQQQQQQQPPPQPPSTIQNHHHHHQAPSPPVIHHNPPPQVLSSTSTPHFRKETYTDPHTGETTTTTITTVVTTTTVTKPAAATTTTAASRDEDHEQRVVHVDVEEERRLAEELLATAHAVDDDDDHAPPLLRTGGGGLYPAPPPMRRKSGVDTARNDVSAAAVPVATVKRASSSRGGHPVTRPECLLDENSDFGPPKRESGRSLSTRQLRASVQPEQKMHIVPPAELIAPQPREQHHHYHQYHHVQAEQSTNTATHSPPTTERSKSHHLGGYTNGLTQHPLPDIQEAASPTPTPPQQKPKASSSSNSNASSASGRAMPIMAHVTSPQLVYPLTPPLDPQDEEDQVTTTTNRGSWVGGESTHKAMGVEERNGVARAQRDSWGRTTRVLGGGGAAGHSRLGDSGRF